MLQNVLCRPAICCADAHTRFYTPILRIQLCQHLLTKHHLLCGGLLLITCSKNEYQAITYGTKPVCFSKHGTLAKPITVPCAPLEPPQGCRMLFYACVGIGNHLLQFCLPSPSSLYTFPFSSSFKIKIIKGN